jgi:hypothetical protein
MAERPVICGVKKAMTDSSKILVHRVGDAAPWTAPESSSYINEAHLQEILAASPHWVPGVPEGSLSVRELHTSAGPVDVAIVSPQGALTVVECKLEANPEKRRMVIGQVIDYASAISSDGFDYFHTAWSARGGLDFNTSLAPEGVEELRSCIGTATIGLCLAVDRIDGELQRLIEYLNRITHDRIAVTALQLSYARHRELEVLIPSTYGGEIAAAKASHSGRRSEYWTRESFVEAVEDLGFPDDHAFLKRLLELLDENSRAPRHGQKDALAFEKRGVFFRAYGLTYPPFQLAINGGRLTIAGCWTKFKVGRHPGFAQLAELLGLKLTDSASFVRVLDLNITPDELWRVAEQTALDINGLGAAPAETS